LCASIKSLSVADNGSRDNNLELIGKITSSFHDESR